MKEKEGNQYLASCRCSASHPWRNPRNASKLGEPLPPPLAEISSNNTSQFKLREVITIYTCFCALKESQDVCT